MMSEVNIVRSLPETEWRRFIEHNPHSSIFHTPEMFEVFAHTKGYRPTLWAAVNEMVMHWRCCCPCRLRLEKV